MQGSLCCDSITAQGRVQYSWSLITQILQGIKKQVLHSQRYDDIDMNQKEAAGLGDVSAVEHYCRCKQGCVIRLCQHCSDI